MPGITGVDRIDEPREEREGAFKMLISLTCGSDSMNVHKHDQSDMTRSLSLWVMSVDERGGNKILLTGATVSLCFFGTGL